MGTEAGECSSSPFVVFTLYITFTNTIRPTESLFLASPLVKQNIKLVWPYVLSARRTESKQMTVCTRVCTPPYIKYGKNTIATGLIPTYLQ